NELPGGLVCDGGTDEIGVLVVGLIDVGDQHTVYPASASRRRLSVSMPVRVSHPLGRPAGPTERWFVCEGWKGRRGHPALVRIIKIMRTRRGVAAAVRQLRPSVAG